MEIAYAGGILSDVSHVPTTGSAPGTDVNILDDENVNSLVAALSPLA